MITYRSLLNEISNNGYHILRNKLSDPEHTINDILLFSSGFTDIYHEPAVVLHMHDFQQYTPCINGLYIIIQDTDDDHGVAPDYGNWLLLASGTEITSLLNYLRNALIISRRIDYASITLSESFMSSATLQSFLTSAEKVLGNPLFLSDNSTKVLCWSDKTKFESMDDELIRSILDNGYVTPELYDKYNYANYLETLENSEGAVIRKSQFPEKTDRIVAKLTINGTYFGWLISAAFNRAFDETDCRVMEIIVKMTEMLLETQTASFSSDFRENLFTELISGQILNETEFWARAKFFNWKRSENYRIVLIGFRESSSLQDNLIAVQIKNHLAIIFPDNCIFLYRNKLCLVIESDSTDIVLQQIRPFLNYYKLDMAVGECFHNITDLKKDVETALDILTVGPLLNPEENEYAYGRYILYHYISMMCEYIRSTDEYAPELVRLSNYDIKHGTDYFNTLRVYVNTRSAVTAAEKLHIHRNTMNYRIKKIFDITSCDIEDPENLNKLWLAYTLYDISTFKSNFYRTN